MERRPQLGYLNRCGRPDAAALRCSPRQYALLTFADIGVVAGRRRAGVGCIPVLQLRNFCPLFGAGAAAQVVEPSPRKGGAR